MLALFAVLAILPGCSKGPGTATKEGDAGAPFPLEGWRYGEIGEVPAADRYRVRLDVRARSFRPTSVPGEAGTSPETPPAEFRLMLERRDAGDFSCLRCVDGELELIRFADGSRVPASGKPRAKLPFLVDLFRHGGEPMTLALHVDRSPGRWAVSLFGEEILATPAARQGRRTTPAGPDAAPPDGAGIAWSATPEWRLEARSVQPLEPIAFDDAFERTAFGETGEYEILSGEWRLDSPGDTSRTVNAFRLKGSVRSGPPAIVTVGRDFWRNYRVEASIKFPRQGTGGLVFAGRPGRRLGILRWRCPPPGQPSAEGTGPGGRGLLEVLEAEGFTPPEWASRPCAGYTERKIASLPWRPRHDQWYRIAVSVFEESGELEVNGRRFAFRLPPGLRSGVCGLYSESVDGVLFDDVRVRSNAGFVHARGDLVAPLAQGAEGWAQLVDLPDGPVRLRVRAARNADTLCLRWPVEGRKGGGKVRLVVPGRVVRTSVGPDLPGREGKGRLDRIRGGSGAAARLRDFAVPTGLLEREVAVEIADDDCTVLDGARTVAWVELPAGRSGPVEILQRHGELATAVDYLAGQPLAPVATVRRRSPVFDKVDVTVNNEGEKYPEIRWGGFVGWIEDQGAWDVSAETVRFRAPIWGEVEAELDLGPPEKSGEEGRTGLFFLLDRGEETAFGASFVRDSGGVAVVGPHGNVLSRWSDDRASPPAGGGIRLRRRAGSVEAAVGGETVFRAAVDERAAVRVEARGPGVTPGNLSIRAKSVDESHFDAAPVEWIRWRGHWDVTDKWRCDPRWTFLGLWADAPDTMHEAAGLFSRASYWGDQHLHFNFAFKDMLGGSIEQRRYIRRDLNFAFCCDGEDLASGYCVLIGGFDNRGTQLLRKGELVAEAASPPFPKFTGGVGDIHWMWYSLEVSRREGAIAVTMNGKSLIEWTDPDPLEGGHAAAWVLGGGMILGRTRFSAERRGPELAGFDTDPRAAASSEGWRPLDGDHPVAIRETYARAVRVTNRAGGGHFGAEFTAPPGDGLRSPGALAFRASELTRVQASVFRRGAAGVAGPAVLPAGKGETLPADGEWHLLPLEGREGELASVRFGLWEAEGYLAAGIGGNPAGAWYEVKFFRTLDAAKRFCSSAPSEDAF